MEPTNNGGTAPADWLLRVMTPQLDEHEKRIRDAFVTEFLKDEDGLRAAMRVGFGVGLAEDYAKKFLGEPYVQQQLDARRIAVPATKSEERALATATRARLKAALMHEAFYHGRDSTQAARVKALQTLMTLEGMLNGSTGTSTSRAGGATGSKSGVMVVPPMETLPSWESKAQASQGKLIADASN